jgi:BON domain-containing protein
MPEMPFGSVIPIWPAVQGPALGYAQAPVSQSPQSIGPSVSTPQGTAVLSNATISGVPMGTTFPINAYGLSSPVAALAGLAPNTFLSLGSPLTGLDARFGIAAPALLAAVAMRRGQPLGPTSENEIEDFVYDALDLLSGGSDVDVRCEGGRVTLTGSVPHKRLKRDIGEIAWTIPAVNDVQNNIAIAARRRSRGHRENETPTVAARKQA